MKKNQLFTITWPIFIELVLFMLLGTVDILMLGNYSDDAVGAVGIVNQVISMFNIMFGIISSGTAIVCAQYIGMKKNQRDMQRLMGASLLLNGVVGIFISGIALLFANPILKAMNVSPDFWNYSHIYFLVVGGSLIVQAISTTLTAILRSYGFTKHCMYVTLIMNIINIGCNYFLIYGNFGMPRLGVLGAAISTTLSKILGMAALCIFVWRILLKDFSFRLLSPFPFQELKTVLRLGTPAAGESIAYNASKVVITVILTYLGNTAVTANSYLGSITMFVYIFAVAMGQGSSILVGRLVGEQKNDRAYSLCLSSFYWSLGITITVSVIVFIFGHQILGLFTSSEEIISLGVSILFVDILAEAGRSANVVIINCLRAAGDVQFPVYIGILSMWGIGVGCGYLFGIVFGWGMLGLWLALALDESIRGIIMFIRWKCCKWHGKSITQ